MKEDLYLLNYYKNSIDFSKDGEKVYYLKVLKPNNDKEEFTSADGFFCYDYLEKGEYSFEITIGFTNNNSLFGDSYHFDFNANFL